MEIRSRDCLVFLGISTLYICFAQAASTSTKCYKNQEIGEYPENVYYCEDTAKPECCEQDSKFTCCETKSKHIAKDQIILWGCVFGAVGTITFIWICYRKDTYLCEGAPLSQHCGCCSSPDKTTEDKPIGSDQPCKFDRKYDKVPGEGQPEVKPDNHASGTLTSRSIQPIFVAEAEQTPVAGCSGLQVHSNMPSEDRLGEESNSLVPDPDFGPEYPGYELPEYYGQENSGYGQLHDADNSNPGKELETMFGGQKAPMPEVLYNPVLDNLRTPSQPSNALPPLDIGGRNLDENKRKKKKKTNKAKKDKKKNKQQTEEEGTVDYYGHKEEDDLIEEDL